MRNVQGFVCVARPIEDLERRLIFGKNQTNGTASYENLQTNDLQPYADLKDAKQGQTGLRQRKDISAVRIARLEMTIGDTAPDIARMMKKKDLIVIKIDEGGHWLYGPMVEGRPSIMPVPGAYLYDTNFTTFSSYEDAENVAREVNRQGRSAVWIATFKLRYQR